jgi:hypothetical protein
VRFHRWAAPLLALASFTCSRPEPDGRFALTIELVEGTPPKSVPGLLRIRNAQGSVIPVESLLPRGVGLESKHRANDWHVLPGKSTLRLPREKLTIEAFRGLDTELSRVEVDGALVEEAAVRIPLRRFADEAGRGWRGANTHLHLKDIDRAEADRYLREVPSADGLDVLFVSYLERAEADRTYISNRYSEDDLRDLSKQCGVLLGNGEEHRHNFSGFNEGYGHVMFLDLRKLIRPVSIGRGIMKAGLDAPALQRGIDEAKRGGATILWCHNTFGLEDIPNWITGRPHAQNIFDGDPEAHGSYRDTFYRYLNAGLRVPFSTGTDWFIYDFSRAYAAVPKLASPGDWLRALEAGRTYITNGPLLEFDVDKKGIGETLTLDQPGRVRVTGRAIGRVDFRRLELVRNGEIIGSADSRSSGGHFEASLETVVAIDAPCWLALRIPPPPTKEEPAAETSRTELGGPLFAHTSPVYVEVGGRKVFQADVARGLLDEMRKAQESITANGVFADAHERDHVLSVYALAISALEKKLVK